VSSSDVAHEKAAAAEAAAARVRPGMTLALGTGSTAALAVRALAERFPDGGSLTAVASSNVTERLARDLGLTVRSLEEDDEFDLMIDGADEVTAELALTKGGGGAFFREKYLARIARELVIVIDHTKLVPALGSRARIPVEIVPFARPILQRRIRERGLDPILRTARDGSPAQTDNGNEILDLQPPEPLEDPESLDGELRALPGVVETGLFVRLAHRAIVGLPDGSVRELVAPTVERRPA
jgi:ribose 5-phosphate isomerase A